MPMNIIQAERHTMGLLTAGNAAIWSSGSGLGKSTVAYRLFERLRDRDAPKGINWGFCSFFAATQQPTDLVGIQFKGNREYKYIDPVTQTEKIRQVTVSDPAIPLWMISEEGKPAFMYDKVFLLIDEYGQGELDTKRSIAEVFLNGGVNPWYLPAGSVRLACTNQGSRYGVSKDFDFAIARRFQIDIVGDIGVTMDYLDKPYEHQGRTWHTLPATKLWAKQHPEVVFEPEPKEQGPWCNPRQLCAADRYIQAMWEINGNTEIDAEMISVIAGGIGMPATTSMVSAFQFMLELPQYEEVVADPAGTPVPNRPDLQMLMVYQLAAMTKKEDVAAVIQYINRKEMPKDMAITFITSFLRRDFKGLMTHPAVMAWVNNNATLVATVSALAQQQ